MQITHTFILFTILLLANYAIGVNLEEDLFLTENQKSILDQFKSKAGPILTRGFMKEEMFLIRWLRAKNFDIEKAFRMLKDHLKFREEQNLDSIDDEDWCRFEVEFPNLIIYDREGRPGVYRNFGRWDLRREAIRGSVDKLSRWLLKGLEDGAKLVRKLQADDKNVTQFNHIFNLDHFAPITHMCIQCLPIYTTLASQIEFHYPGMIHKLMGLNAPTSFNIVLNIAKSLVTEVTFKSLVMYERNNWQGPFNDLFDKSEIPYDLGIGGTKLFTD